MPRKTSPFFLIAALCVLVPACHQQFRIRLATADERIPNPSFVVEDPSQPGDRARYNTVRLLGADGEILWHLRAEPFTYKNSVPRITYGEPLEGYVTIVEPAPLEVNRRYGLNVSGRGTCYFRFEVDSGGVVHTR